MFHSYYNLVLTLAPRNFTYKNFLFLFNYDHLVLITLTLPARLSLPHHAQPLVTTILLSIPPLPPSFYGCERTCSSFSIPRILHPPGIFHIRSFLLQVTRFPSFCGRTLLHCIHTIFRNSFYNGEKHNKYCISQCSDCKTITSMFSESLVSPNTKT